MHLQVHDFVDLCVGAVQDIQHTTCVDNIGSFRLSNPPPLSFKSFSLSFRPGRSLCVKEYKRAVMLYCYIEVQQSGRVMLYCYIEAHQSGRVMLYCYIEAQQSGRVMLYCYIEAQQSGRVMLYCYYTQSGLFNSLLIQANNSTYYYCTPAADSSSPS